MKKILLLLVTILVLQFAPQTHATDLSNCTSWIVAGTEKEARIIHPSNLLSWLVRDGTAPITMHMGQIAHCKVNGIELNVSARHVIEGFGWKQPLKTTSLWVSASDGREISFEKASHGTLKFPSQASDVAPPKHGKATIKGSAFITQPSIHLKEIEIPGNLEFMSDKKELEELNSHFNEKFSIMKRRLKRAPTTEILTMKIPENYRDMLRCLPGALVWQNGKPVGVFVSCLMLDNNPPIALIEPLKESAVATLPHLK